MENVKIVFTEPWKVEVHKELFQEDKLQTKEILVRKLYSLISVGTELACLSGGESWFQMPDVPGYSAVSEIIALGSEVADYQIGDKILHYGNHAKYQVISTEEFLLKVPAQLDLRWVPFTRMATIAMTSTRVSQIELGDYVGISGMGLIGNMAAQLAKLQGGTTIGIDLSESRLRLAKESCGLNFSINSGNNNVKQRIMELTRGEGLNTMIEATGVPQVAVDAFSWIKRSGEMILLGSPRGEYQTNITDIFNYCHLYKGGDITLKGAHEWRYPITPQEFVKHSFVRNSLIALRLMEERRLQIEPLISHVIRPEEAPTAYANLRSRKEEYNGVLINWMQ